MIITPKAVQAFSITEASALDEITIVLEDLQPGRGRILIECYGKAWAAGWMAMGQRGVAQFVATSPAEYVCGALWPQDRKASTSGERYLLRIVEAVQAALRAIEEDRVALPKPPKVLRPRKKNQTAECARWNKTHTVGCAVDLRRDAGDVLRTTTTSKAYIAESGKAVIMLEGVSGYYLLERVTAVEATRP